MTSSDQPSPTPSPLSLVRPDSLDVLMNLDPDDMTEEHIGRIVDALRADRERFLAQPEKAPAKEKKKAADLNLTIDDLGI